MNQKLSDWASVAEIVSGLAVVITLIFLVASIRANTAAVRADTYESNMDDINAFQFQILNNADSFRVWEAWVGDRGENLDAADSFRLGIILGAQVRELESTYYSYRYDLIGEQEWQRLRRGLCGIIRNIESAERRLPNLTEEFVTYVDENCPTASPSDE